MASIPLVERGSLCPNQGLDVFHILIFCFGLLDFFFSDFLFFLFSTFFFYDRERIIIWVFRKVKSIWDKLDEGQ